MLVKIVIMYVYMVGSEREDEEKNVWSCMCDVMSDVEVSGYKLYIYLLTLPYQLLYYSDLKEGGQLLGDLTLCRTFKT